MSGIQGYVIPCAASCRGHRDLRLERELMTYLMSDHNREQLTATRYLRPEPASIRLGPTAHRKATR